jgi:sugar/nucleoside kinase (ribokinase family)
MAKFIIIGPLAKDKIVKSDKIYPSIGGAVYYQTAVFSRLGIDNTAIITLAEKDDDLINDLPSDTDIIPICTKETMEFENIYPDDNPNHRIQRAFIPNNPINPGSISKIIFKDFDAILLSPLSPSDIPLNTLKYLSQFKKPIYLGAQGYMRHIENGKVVLKPWVDYGKFLKYVKLLFLDELEARVILGMFTGNCDEIARKLTSFGPEEVIITRGDHGALIYSRKTRVIESYDIPAFPPKKITDPTGLGDTFMAAYAAEKLESDNPEVCGIFASLVSSIKMEHKGAFQGEKILIEERMKKYFHKK